MRNSSMRGINEGLVAIRRLEKIIASQLSVVANSAKRAKSARIVIQQVIAMTFVLLGAYSLPAYTQDLSFDEYLAKVSARAIAEGVSRQVVTRAFKDLTPDARVIGHDAKQPEFVQSFDEYLQSRVTPFRKSEGRRLYIEHKELLDSVAEKYGVDAEYIVAFWGLETSFGRYQGNYSIIKSLATLGHDPRRSAFFTKELIDALKILDQGHVSFENFVGAWAGAMGQGQFMPSSFLEYAQDFDGDGKKDIWSNKSDIFASIANYLKQSAWRLDAGWGGAVTLSESMDLTVLMPKDVDSSCRALRQHTRLMTIGEWRNLGVTVPAELNDSVTRYALVIPEASSDTSYLVGGNFRTILRYNCANKYAVSVGLLADAIMSPQSS